MTILAAFILFALALSAMAIGLLLRGKVMRGGCGSHSAEELAGCDACSKKVVGLCDEEDDMNIADVAFAGTMGRFSKKQKVSRTADSAPVQDGSGAGGVTD